MLTMQGNFVIEAWILCMASSIHFNIHFTYII